MDYRVKWLKERVLSFYGFDHGELFDEMLEANDGELQEKLNAFLNEPLVGSNASLEKVVFNVHKIYHDKLIQVEKAVPEWSKIIKYLHII